MEFALSVLFGLFVGQWLDKKWTDNGWLTAIGFGFGLAAGTRAIYRALMRANRQAEEEIKREAEQKQKYFDETKL
jgi:F0F1-type ATP synthase assembly protein I